MKLFNGIGFGHLHEGEELHLAQSFEQALAADNSSFEDLTAIFEGGLGPADLSQSAHPVCKQNRMTPFIERVQEVLPPHVAPRRGFHCREHVEHAAAFSQRKGSEESLRATRHAPGELAGDREIRSSQPTHRHTLPRWTSTLRRHVCQWGPTPSNVSYVTPASSRRRARPRARS